MTTRDKLILCLNGIEEAQIALCDDVGGLYDDEAAEEIIRDGRPRILAIHDAQAARIDDLEAENKRLTHNMALLLTSLGRCELARDRCYYELNKCNERCDVNDATAGEYIVGLEEKNREWQAQLLATDALLTEAKGRITALKAALARLVEAGANMAVMLKVVGQSKCLHEMQWREGIEDPDPEDIEAVWLDYIASGLAETYRALIPALDAAREVLDR